MSAYPDRSKKALLVIDVQNGVVDYSKNRNAIVARSAELNRACSDYDLPDSCLDVMAVAKVQF